MNLAETLILCSSLATLGCAGTLAFFVPGAPLALPIALAGASVLSAVPAFAVSARRRALARVAVDASRIDLPLATAVVLAVPETTEVAVLTAIDTLNILRSRCQAGTDSLSGDPETLADLDRLLEALQFQDLTRQMLESAAAILDIAGERLRETAEGPRLAGADKTLNERFEAARKDLLARAKTKDEKNALMEVRL